MKYIFGLNEYLYRQKKTRENVIINPQELINGHFLLTGMSGTGKSNQAKRLIKSAIKQNLQVDSFNVHNELEQLGTISALYSVNIFYAVVIFRLIPPPLGDFN